MAMRLAATPLKFALNFSQVHGAKNPSLANLLSQRLEKQSKNIVRTKQQGHTRGYGNPFPTCIISLLQDKIVS